MPKFQWTSIFFSKQGLWTDMSLSILNDKNLEGTEKAIFTKFSLMKVSGYNITYCKTHKLKYNDLIYVNLISSSPDIA